MPTFKKTTFSYSFRNCHTGEFRHYQGTINSTIAAKKSVGITSKESGNWFLVATKTNKNS